MKDAVSASEPLKEDVYTPGELHSLITYSQNKVIQSFEKGLEEFHFRYYPACKQPEDARVVFRQFFSRDLAYS
jgi:hypothetical protein